MSILLKFTTAEVNKTKMSKLTIIFAPSKETYSARSLKYPMTIKSSKFKIGLKFMRIMNIRLSRNSKYQNIQRGFEFSSKITSKRLRGGGRLKKRIRRTL